MQQKVTVLSRHVPERRRYPLLWETLNNELQALEQRDGNLLGVTERLREHQLDTGLIRDDLGAVQCYRFPHPDNPQRFLSVQYNPARVNRLKIRYDALQPPRGDAVHDSCLLCPANIQWQHRGAQFGYDIEEGGVAYSIWMNVYPLMPLHLVVATRAHVPLAWKVPGNASGLFSINTIVANIASLAMRMPGFVGFYNGAGAGASIPAHFHYQFFHRRSQVSCFPLELAPARHLDDCCAVIEDYPVDAMCWQSDDPNEAVSRATRWIQEWLLARTGLRPGLSANIFAMCDVERDLLRIYFVPRDHELCHSPHMAGTIGSLEILGELVLTTELEKIALDRGEIDYHSIERILNDIRVAI